MTRHYEPDLQLVLAREGHEVDIVGEGQLLGSHRPPDALAQQQVGLRELDGERDAPVHRLREKRRGAVGPCFFAPGREG